MEEIFQIRRCTVYVLTNNIKIYRTDQYMFYR